MHIPQIFDLETQGSVHLLNLPGFWRVSCWIQGLGTFLPIYLDLNARTPNFLLRNPRIDLSTESIRILKGILLDPRIRYIYTDLPGSRSTYLQFLIGLSTKYTSILKANLWLRNMENNYSYAYIRILWVVYYSLSHTKVPGTPTYLPWFLHDTTQVFFWCRHTK